ncbi:hypothetical protein [Spiroplasma endosymbiont of Sarcophaga variegata]|uniref:hypothetical protein n=1 Tax=Spiroplasma endosymbiont of Sarcophaga variegata TaxID=3066304 RepID=UPI003AF6D120
MNRIVLEGIDGVGKTTFANKLMNNLSSKGMIIHSDSKTPNTYEWYSELNNNTCSNIIFDRYAYGELVYSKLFNRKAKLTVNDLEKLELEIANKNGYIVYYQATKKIIKKAHLERKEDFNWKQLKRADKLFKKLLLKRKTKCDVFIMKRKW